MVSTVIESPSPADCEPGEGGLLEHFSDPVPFRGVHGDGHHPVGVEAIEEERGTMEHKLGALGPNKLAMVWVWVWVWVKYWAFATSLTSDHNV